MKKVIAVLAVAGLTAAPAMADLSTWTPPGSVDMPIFTAEAVAPVGLGGTVSRAPARIYDSLAAGTAGYLAFPGASGVLGYDDFVTNSGTALVSDFYFVGGVAATGQVINFYFLNTAFATVNSFGLTFPQGGNFIWTVGGFPTSASASPFLIPHTGYLVAVAPTGSIGQWFLSSQDALVVGGNQSYVGGAYATSGGVTTASLLHLFALGGIPEPATLALLVASGAVFFVRRRK